jgi:LacI family transcriptional regulator, galactose operon repressor
MRRSAESSARRSRRSLQGYAVGSDVAVVGFNDVSIAAHLPIPLSTVRSPLKDMGRAAASLVLRRIETHGANGTDTESSTEIRLQPRLIVRKSSDSSVDLRQMQPATDLMSALPR